MEVKQADPNPMIADRGQKIHKSAKGNASQFFVAAELCRRGYYAVVTLGNTPNTDILCSNLEGTRFVHIQVKTFTPGAKKCIVGKKAEMPFEDNFFWVLAGIPEPPSLSRTTQAEINAANLVSDSPQRPSLSPQSGNLPKSPLLGLVREDRRSLSPPGSALPVGSRYSAGFVASDWAAEEGGKGVEQCGQMVASDRMNSRQAGQRISPRRAC